MATRTITVLVPTVEQVNKEIPIAPRAHDLNGKVLGLLWNSKPKSDILLLRIKEQLCQRFRLAGTNWQEKSNAGVPADAATIEELTHNSDLVIVASGD